MEQNIVHSDDETNLMIYAKLIWKYKIIFFAFVILCAGTVLVKTLLSPPQYKATATFYTIDINMALNESPLTVYSRQRGLEKGLELEYLVVSILESRSMADKIINSLDLRKIWNIEKMSQARARLKKMTELRVNKSGSMELSIISDSPELASQIANTYIDYIEALNEELELGVMKQLIRILDRAIIPEERMPRRALKKVLLAGLVSGIIAFVFIFVLENIRMAQKK